MTGKAYYITTLADWQRHSARFANSHFIVLNTLRSGDVSAGACSRRLEPELAPAPPRSQPSRRRWLSLHARKMARDTPAASNITGVESEASARSALLAKPRSTPEQARSADSGGEPPHSTNTNTHILVLIEADEGVHLSLDDDPAFEPLPHPLAQKPISAAAQSALAPHGVAPGATTFDAAEALARVHPLLRHRVF